MHLHRAKYVPKGGPDGGDGGRGGHIILKANPQFWTLIHLKYRKHVKADNGGNGEGGLRTGKNGQDIILEVLRRLTVKGGVGKVMEYVGDGVATLTVPERALYTQDNMVGVVVVDGQYQTFIPVNVLENRDGTAFISAIQQGVLAEGQTVRLF